MGSLSVTLQTNKGDIKLNLFEDKTPITVANFINLSVREFYKGILFHRVLNDFMVQCGCPDGIGTGGPGYNFQDECTPDLKHTKPGILSMANAGPGTNGSQIFVTHVATPWLDGKHTVFGETADEESLKTLFKIVQGDKINSVKIDGDYTALFEKQAGKLKEWNEALDKGFPNLPKS